MRAAQQLGHSVPVPAHGLSRQLPHCPSSFPAVQRGRICKPASYRQRECLQVVSAQQHEPAHLSSYDDPLDGVLARLQQLNAQHRASRKAAAHARYARPRRSPRRPQRGSSSANTGSSSGLSGSHEGGSSSNSSMPQVAPSQHLSSPSRQGAPPPATKAGTSPAKSSSSRTASVQVVDVSSGEADPDDPNQASLNAVLAKIYGRDVLVSQAQAGSSSRQGVAVMSAASGQEQQQQHGSGGGGSVGIAERGAGSGYDDHDEEEEDEEEEEEEDVWPQLDEASSIYSLFGRGLTPERPAPSQASIDATLRAVLTEIFGPHGPQSQEADNSSSSSEVAQQGSAPQGMRNDVGLGADSSAARAATITDWAGPDQTSIDATLDAVLSRVFGPPAGAAQQQQQQQQQQQEQQQRQGAAKKGRVYSLFGQVLTPDDPAPSQESIDAALSTVLAQVFGEGGLQQHQQEQQQKQQQQQATSSAVAGSSSSESAVSLSEQQQQEGREAPSPAAASSSHTAEGAQEQEQGDAGQSRAGQGELAARQQRAMAGAEGSGAESGPEESRESEVERKERRQKDSKGAERPPGFKGFGLPPTKSGAASPAASPSKAEASTPSTSPGRASFPASSSVPPLPVFLYCAEVGKTNEAIQRLGLEQHVKVVEDLKQAKAVLSVKMSRGGRQNNLQQGKRTAANHGIPFICVGRRMTQETLLPAIAQLLLDHRAQHGHKSDAGDDLTRVLVAAAKAAEQRVQVQPGWAQRMMTDMGL